MAEEMEIEIDKSGKVTMRTRGVKGPECMKLADLLAQIVGREESRQTTQEFRENPEQAVIRQNVRQQQS
jgi:Protein of unknown function (DUF2997)